MSAIATLKMLLLGEDKTASSALNHAGDTAERTGKKFNVLGGHSTLLGHKFGSLSKIAGGVFAGGAMLQGGEMAIDLLKDSAKAAAADEKENAVLAAQMKNVAHARGEDIKSTEEWLKKQAEATGISKDQLTPALTKLVTATHDTGKAQDLLSLAMNVSAGTGKDLGAVSLALAKAQNGNVSGLGRLGIATKDAEGKTLSFKQIQENLATTFKGDAATAADTAQGRMKRLSVTWDEMKVTLGEKLLPVLISFAGFMLDKVIPVVMNVSGVISRHTSLLVIVGAVVGALVGGPLLALAAVFIILWTRSATFRDVMTGAFHAIAAAGTWMWNNVLEPAFKLLLTGISWIMEGWSKMLGALGHVPGFGWAKDASKAMGDAASAALNIRDSINKIPDHKDVTVNIVPGKIAKTVGGVQIMANVGHNATGTPSWRGGLTWVGEQGPELADMPGGTRIWNARDSARIAAGGGGGAGGHIGTLTVVVRSDTGEIIEQKLVRLKRSRGGTTLEFSK